MAFERFRGICFNSCVASVGRALRWRLALALVASYEQPDSVTMSTLVQILERADGWRLALHAMSSFKALKRDAIAQTVALKACEKGKQWAMAIQMLGGGADEICYQAAMVVCEGCSQWEWALELLPLAPSISGLSTALKAMAMVKRWQKALSVLSERRSSADGLAWVAVNSGIEALHPELLEFRAPKPWSRLEAQEAERSWLSKCYRAFGGTRLLRVEAPREGLERMRKASEESVEEPRRAVATWPRAPMASAMGASEEAP